MHTCFPALLRPYRVVLALTAAALALVLAGPAAAGPDVVHSDITDTTHYGPVTVAGTPVHAYAWGSATCNLGDAPLAWLSRGSPGLAMNAYRLHDGRLEQIGLGFCKTACCAANGPGCGPACSTVGTGLRAGCRDLYFAGINGAQGYLGPRSGIDPYGGSFTAIPVATGDAIWRRLQIAQPEMSPTTYTDALYFAEGVYAATDEAPAQKLNNASYRRETIANTGAAPNYFWTAAAPTEAGRPAIFAWRDHGLGADAPDPSVTVVPADVPGEGRFFIASKARDLGDGRWRYEYAVFNLNSQLAAARLSIPLPSSAVVSESGFRDVAYHSGEAYDGTDWAVTRVGSTVEWRTAQTFGENPNANALRWGTMYNFWFTADVAPAANPGPVTLGLFRPFEPGSIEAAGLSVPAVPCTACRADHNCTGGLSIQDLFEFLGDFFALSPRADFNSANAVTLQDLLDYLSAYFTGCG